MIDPGHAIVITGASQGIGRYAAVEFARLKPHPLILIARNRQGLDETARLCREAGSEEVHIIPCDLSSISSVQRLTEQEGFNRIAVLFNNAGYFLQKPVLESDAQDYFSQIESNTLSAINITRALLPQLERMPESRIIFTNSVTVQRGQARCGAYSVSKQALNGYIESLREALYDSSIAVTSLTLGQTWSTSWKGSGVDPKRLADPADIGKMLAFLCDVSKQSCVEEIVIRPQKGDL